MEKTNLQRRSSIDEINFDEVDDIQLDTDEILNFEVENYQKGFKEGQSQSAKSEFLEGKQYGYQTGFQKFLIVGYIQGLVEDWELKIEQYRNIELQLKQLREFVYSIPTVNDDSEVEEYEKKLLKARNKLRVIVAITKESWKIDQLDNLVKEVGGTLQVSENVDEMW